MHPDGVNVKYNDTKVNQAMCGTAAQEPTTGTCYNAVYDPSLRNEAEKDAAHLFALAQKRQAAANFLREHPEFDEFIRLIRSASISI